MKRALFLILCSFSLGFSSLNIASYKDHHEEAEKHFTIIIPSYNNSTWAKKNLLSALEQKYDQFHVVYIDDASTDGTDKIIQDIVTTHPKKEKITVIRNPTNRGALYNTYVTVHSLPNDEICLILDGDDFLAHHEVLKKLNHYYYENPIWLSYGQFVFYPQGTIGHSKPLPKTMLKERKIRHASQMNIPWEFSHVRTFYAGLYKRIHLKDLIEKGKFFATTCDLATMFPMIEMAPQNTFFIKDILYVYNQENPSNDCKIHLQEQKEMETKIRRASSYYPLKESPIQEFTQEDVDILIFSFNRPLQLYALLESIEKRVKGINTIEVIYRSSQDRYEQGYKIVKERFPHAIYRRQAEKKEKAFKEYQPYVLDAIKKGSSPYIVFAVDDIMVTDDIDLREATVFMKETGAYGFYYRLGHNIHRSFMENRYTKQPDFIEVKKGVYAWQFDVGDGDWGYPSSVDFNLFEKAKILRSHERGKYTFPGNHEDAWRKAALQEGVLHEVGLCYKNSKTVNCPMNIVSIHHGFKKNEYRCNPNLGTYSTEDLMEKMEQGLKIDVDHLYKVSTSSCHENVEICFIPRAS